MSKYFEIDGYWKDTKDEFYGLLENNMCSHAGDELIEQKLKEINCA